MRTHEDTHTGHIHTYEAFSMRTHANTYVRIVMPTHEDTHTGHIHSTIYDGHHAHGLKGTTYSIYYYYLLLFTTTTIYYI
jgi:hypothetical protein